MLVGAGDIADCKSPGAALTAQLLDRTEGIVFTTGDNAYPSGSAAAYRDCYDPTWGRHRDRTRPSLGNHDVESSNGQPYYEYFGGNAGPPGSATTATPPAPGISSCSTARLRPPPAPPRSSGYAPTCSHIRPAVCRVLASPGVQLGAARRRPRDAGHLADLV